MRHWKHKPQIGHGHFPYAICVRSTDPHCVMENMDFVTCLKPSDPPEFLTSPKTVVESSAVVLRYEGRRTFPLADLDEEFEILSVIVLSIFLPHPPQTVLGTLLHRLLWNLNREWYLPTMRVSLITFGCKVSLTSGSLILLGIWLNL